MQDAEKIQIFLTGLLDLPLSVSQPAVVIHAGGIVRTDPVTAIRSVDTGALCFETDDTVYRVLFSRKRDAIRMPVACVA